MKCFTILALLLLASCAREEGPVVSISDAWARPTLSAGQAGVVYVTVTNTGSGADRLDQVSTGVGSASMHESSMAAGVMRMRPMTDGVAVPGHSVVEFKPNSLHIMLDRLKTPLVAGSHFPVTLHFQKSGNLEAQVEVRGGAEAHGGNHPQ